jgi:FKBP-type peptidyl-prolyl cis-trans isomerase FkpA
MQNIKSLLFLFIVTLILSCKSETGDFTTTNGYKYVIHKRGTGNTAKVGDNIFYAMTIKLDSQVVQEINDPTNYPSLKLDEKMKAEKSQLHFFEMFSNVKKGDSLTMYIPVDSLPKGNPMMDGKKMITYAITIKDVLDSVSMAKKMEVEKAKQKAKMEESQKRIPEVKASLDASLAQYKAKSLKFETTSSGLKYVVHSKGNGPIAKQNDMVSVDYYGVLTDGTLFDNSYDRGQPYSFPVGVGQVIKGWDEAMMMLPKGTKATLFVPSNLGYGEQASGPIPPNSELVFYIEIM